MTIKTGTRSPWSEFDGHVDFDYGDRAVYVHDGHKVEDEIDYLVEAARADGVIENLATAYKRAESATFHLGYYGLLDSGVAVQCDETGETAYGDIVEPVACIFAVI